MKIMTTLTLGIPEEYWSKFTSAVETSITELNKLSDQITSIVPFGKKKETQKFRYDEFIVEALVSFPEITTGSQEIVGYILQQNNDLIVKTVPNKIRANIHANSQRDSVCSYCNKINNLRFICEENKNITYKCISCIDTSILNIDIDKLLPILDYCSNINIGIRASFDKKIGRADPYLFTELLIDKTIETIFKDDYSVVYTTIENSSELSRKIAIRYTDKITDSSLIYNYKPMFLEWCKQNLNKEDKELIQTAIVPWSKRHHVVNIVGNWRINILNNPCKFELHDKINKKVKTAGETIIDGFKSTLFSDNQGLYYFSTNTIHLKNNDIVLQGEIIDMILKNNRIYYKVDIYDNSVIVL
jgi:hypothetical protein